MSKFYFTYGTSGQPFYGGWTEINAPDIDTACRVFIAFHPCKVSNVMNCCSVYTEEQFKKTCMYENGNHGFRAHEVITVEHQLVTHERSTNND